jgi:uncharacterized membrane protein
MDEITPGRPLANWHGDHREKLTRGQLAADSMRNGMGSWTFVVGFWVVMIAGLQGAILLIAAKRQDAAAALAQHDYETNVAARREIEELTEINRVQLEILRDLHTTSRAIGAPVVATANVASGAELSR